MSQQKVAEAVIAYGAAVQADPKSGEARKKLAEAYARTGEVAKSLREFVNAADLLPGDLPLQLTAGKLLLLAAQYDDAGGRADRVLQKEPKNVEALTLKGNALAGLKDIDAALKQLEAAIQADPTSGMAYLNLGVVQQVKGDATRAEAAFKTAIFNDPKNMLPRLSLANLYWATGRVPEAEKALKDALAIDPTNPTVNRTLAVLYIDAGRMAEAEQPLKVVVAAFPDGVERFTLADYYVLSNRYANARSLLQEIAKSPKADQATAAKLRLAALGFVEGDRATTMRLVDEVLARNTNNPQALVAKAQVQAADGKRDEAMATIRLAVSTNPTSVPARYVLGMFLTDRLQFEEAIAEQKAALAVNTNYGRAHIELARLSLYTGRFEDAVRYAQEAVRLMPDLAQAHLLLARAQLAGGHADLAETPVRLLLNSFPKDPVVQSELGQIQLKKNDLAAARASFERALAANPEETSAIQGLISIDLRQKNGAAARRRAESALAKHPKDSGLQVIAGRTYLAVGDVAAAEKMLKQAVSGGMADFEALSYLAAIYVQQKRLPEAEAEYQRLVKLQPRSVGFLTMTGTLMYLQGKVDQAKTQYEKVLNIDPRAPAAANNLAQIYVDKGENLEVALQLAQTAKAGMSTSHEIDDTLGWIYYKKGMAPQAVSSMKAAVSAQPENAVYLYHLGAAYALNKDKGNARQSLEKALKIQPNFPGADDARKILTSLN